MSTTPWRGTLIFAGTVAAVAAAAAVRFSGAQIEAAPDAAAGAGAQPGGSSSASPSSSGPASPGAASSGTTNGQARPSATSQAATPPTSSTTGDSGATSSGTGGSNPAAIPPAAPSATQDVTIVGSTVQTRYGPLQLSVTFAGADITAVEALQAPGWHGESVQINAYAIPILNREAVAADSAHIDAVTGATVTSGAYLTSLQSAIDQHG